MMNNQEFKFKVYTRGRTKTIDVGDTVMIHPAIRPNGTPSEARRPYEAVIIIAHHDMLCTYVAGGHIAFINDYLFNRMECL